MSSLIMKKKIIWSRGYDWINRIDKKTSFTYSVADKRIAAMAFEAGWKAGKRDAAKKRWIRIS